MIIIIIQPSQIAVRGNKLMALMFNSSLIHDIPSYNGYQALITFYAQVMETASSVICSLWMSELIVNKDTYMHLSKKQETF